MEKVGFDKVETTRWATFSVISATARVWWQWRSYRYRRHWQHQKLGLRSVRGMETDELIGGRGTSDQEGGRHLWFMPVKSLKTSVWKMNIPAGYRYCAGRRLRRSVLAVHIEQSGIRPEFVVSTEPTDCRYTVVSAVVWKFVLMFRVLAPRFCARTR